MNLFQFLTRNTILYAVVFAFFLGVYPQYGVASSSKRDTPESIRCILGDKGIVENPVSSEDSLKISFSPDEQDEIALYREKWKRHRSHSDKAKERFQKNHDEDIKMLLSGKALSEDKRVFSFVNAVQKELNDRVIRSQTLVDAMNNRYRKLLEEELNKSSVLTMRRWDGAFGTDGDFKTYRIEIDVEDDPAVAALVTEEVAKAHLAASNRFVTELQKKYPRTYAKIKEANRLAADPEHWFQIGVGRVAEEADQVSKFNRSRYREVKKNRTNSKLSSRERAGVLSYDDIEFIDLGRKSKNQYDSLLEKLQKKKKFLKEGILVQGKNSGKLIPSRNMIAILRKIEVPKGTDYQGYLSAVLEQMEKRFPHTKVSREEVDTLVQAYRKIQQWDPNAIQKKWEPLNIAEISGRGGLFGDARALGAMNLEYTADALASIDGARAGHITIVRESQKSFQAATKELESSYEETAKITQDFVRGQRSLKAPMGNRADVTYLKSNSGRSGDDWVQVFQDDMTIQDVRSFVGYLHSRLPEGNKAPNRLTYVSGKNFYGKPLDAQVIETLRFSGEDLEKKMAKEFVSVGSYPASQKMTSLIHVSINQNGKAVYEPIFSGKISVKDMKKINKAVSKTCLEQKKICKPVQWVKSFSL
ncbi:MAG: hypothetical protein CL678_03800 [Bdellovibrionaceae bacterium]|nr:hypothetical protein [Pseudobdellovibrionaceae bacterium]|tara:strand:- start:5923 stop:7851 length:1929 start_codon:yes stop_codon:yes gene_type:complete